MDAKLVVLGSAAIDITSQARDPNASLGQHSTSPGMITTSLGGVGRNIAEAAHGILSGISPALSRSTLLVSPIGNDAFGRLIVEETSRLGMRIDGLTSIQSHRSAVCNMVLDGKGSLIGGVADMDIIEALPEDVVRHRTLLNVSLSQDRTALQIIQKMVACQPALVAVDGNLSEATLGSVVKYCSERNIPGM